MSVRLNFASGAMAPGIEEEGFFDKILNFDKLLLMEDWHPN
jgi:hypothetical protein